MLALRGADDLGAFADIVHLNARNVGLNCWMKMKLWLVYAYGRNVVRAGRGLSLESKFELQNDPDKLHQSGAEVDYVMPLVVAPHGDQRNLPVGDKFYVYAVLKHAFAPAGDASKHIPVVNERINDLVGGSRIFDRLRA